MKHNEYFHTTVFLKLVPAYWVMLKREQLGKSIAVFQITMICPVLAYFSIWEIMKNIQAVDVPIRFRAKNWEVGLEIRMKHWGELADLAIYRQLSEKRQGEKRKKQVVYEIGVILKKFVTAEWSINRTKQDEGEELSRFWLPFLFLGGYSLYIFISISWS